VAHSNERVIHVSDSQYTSHYVRRELEKMKLKNLEWQIVLPACKAYKATDLFQALNIALGYVYHCGILEDFNNSRN